MKKRAISLILALAMALSMGAIPVVATEITPEVSSNVNGQHYLAMASTIDSYLFENQAGGLTRVEHVNPRIVTEDSKIIVEDYTSDFQLLTSRTIPMELPIWGGFFAGEDYNFFVFGQENPNESDSVEVIRVVKYSKEWTRLGQASLRGGNTTVPFDASSLRMTEYNGQLYIRTSHEMYTSSDGLNHQANLTLCVDEARMTEAVDADISYVSHSFNQFVLVDSDGYLVALDHGDGYPRAIVLRKYRIDPETSSFNDWPTANITVQTFPGEIGNNTTWSSLGGFAETTSGYVIAYNHYDPTSSSDVGRNVYVGYVSKDSTQGNARVYSIPPDETVTTPQLASTGLNGGYILWNGISGGLPSDTLYYVRYDSTGNVGTPQTATASLSDCQPIYYNGKVVWYTTVRFSAPVFYTLDSNGVTAHDAGGSAVQVEQPAQTTEPEPTPIPTNATFTDVPTTHWAYADVEQAAENGWVQGVGDNKFAPEGTLTFAEYYAMIVRIFAADKLAAYQAPSDSPWWWPYMYVGAKNLPSSTISFETFYEGPTTVAEREQRLLNSINKNAEESISRSDAIYVMWYVLVTNGLDKEIVGVEEAEAKIVETNGYLSAYEYVAVPVCYAAGLISGNERGELNLSSTLTRAEGCTILCNLADYVTAHSN